MSASSPAVSVVIPAWNREAMIARAVESVRAQTLADWELIIVDDGSTDGTVARVEELAREEPRLRLIRHERNRGANAARNTGVQAARAEWIAFLDSDDEWFPQRLERQLALAHEREAAGDAPGIVYGWYFEQWPDGRRTLIDTSHEGSVRRALLAGFFGPSSTLLVRRACFEQCGPMDEKMFTCDEYEFCIRVAGRWPFAVLREPVAITHQHTGHRVTDIPDGWDRLCDIYGAEIAREHGRAILAQKRVLCGAMYRRRGRPGKAAGQFMKAISAWPLAWGAWARLAALPLQALLPERK